MKYNFLKLKLAVLFSVIFMISINAKVIIWDLGNVLFKTNKLSAANQIGLGDYILYPFSTGKKPYAVKDKAFEVLALLQFSNINPNSLALSTDDEGKILPTCFRAYMAGLVTGDKIISESGKVIKELSKVNFFANNREKRLVERTINFIFSTDTLAYAQRPISKAVNLLKQCYKNNHKLIVLSNWASDSFLSLYNSCQGQQVFKYFKPEDILISGNIKLIKPDIKAFNYVINRYKVSPQDCIFIDDQLVNVQAARQCGMTGLVLKNGNYKKLKKELQALRVI